MKGSAILVCPEVEDCGTPTFFAEFSENLGLGYVAARLESRGHRAEILDLNVAPTPDVELARHLASARVDVVGLSGSSRHYLQRSMQLATLIRLAGCTAHTTVGGHYASHCATDVLAQAPAVDSVVLGEGEETLLELLEAVLRKRPLGDVPGLCIRDATRASITASRPAIEDLDTLLRPMRYNAERMVRAGQALHIVSSRGCLGRCTFCTASLAPGWRHRSPANVVDELEQLAGERGAQFFAFMDENFLGHAPEGQERAAAIAHTIIERGLDIEYKVCCRSDDLQNCDLGLLFRSGLRKVNLGIESFCDRQLRYYGKGVTVEDNIRALRLLRAHGLRATLGFIMFDPHVTLDELDRNLTYLREYRDLFDYRKVRTLLRPDRFSPIALAIDRAGLLERRANFSDQVLFADQRAARVFRLVNEARAYLGAVESDLQALRRSIIHLQYVGAPIDRIAPIRMETKRLGKSLLHMWLDIVTLGVQEARGHASWQHALSLIDGFRTEVRADIERLATQTLGLPLRASGWPAECPEDVDR